MQSKSNGFHRQLRAIALVVSTLVLSAFVAGAAAEGAVKPAHGFVPDERTAIAIAEAVLIPVFGEKQIVGERPFHAVLHGNVWEVAGSLPPGWDGGVALVLINKNDGRILRMTHGK